MQQTEAFRTPATKANKFLRKSFKETVISVKVAGKEVAQYPCKTSRDAESWHRVVQKLADKYAVLYPNEDFILVEMDDVSSFGGYGVITAGVNTPGYPGRSRL